MLGICRIEGGLYFLVEPCVQLSWGRGVTCVGAPVGGGVSGRALEGKQAACGDLLFHILTSYWSVNSKYIVKVLNKIGTYLCHSLMSVCKGRRLNMLTSQ